MNVFEKIKNSTFWKNFWSNSESKAALLVTFVLIGIAGFLVYNYYQKTTEEQKNNDQILEELNNENKQNEQQGQTLGTPEKERKTYIVKEGDNLWSIADQELGDPYRWTELKSLNNLSTSAVEPGQLLALPEDALAHNNDTATTNQNTQTSEQPTTTTPTTGTELADTAIGGDTTYTVERGDTLWSIAQKVYGDPYQYTKILEANDLGRLPNGSVLIHAGNVLNIPALD